MKRILLAAALLLALLLAACSPEGNRPYEPDTPPPGVHDGVFASQHGTMRFDGDGEKVEIDFDEALSALTGLPEGKHEGKYVFAHEIRITVGTSSAVIRLGLASGDGKTAQVGANVTTETRIPFLFSEDGTSFHILFLKEGDEK